MEMEILDKGYRKLHFIFWQKLHPGRWSLWLFRAYWHYRFAKGKKGAAAEGRRTLYLTQRPNRGAGIGHQMGNWNSGYWFAERFGVQYAYSPFPALSWDAFLGLGEGALTAKELLRRGYKKRKLPYFDENSEADMRLIQGIIDSYRGKRVVFFLELDQFYAKQYGAMEHIKKKFNSASAREKDRLIYEPDCLNIAVHIRRGDITIGQETKEPGLTKRWLTTVYYERLLRELLPLLPADTAYRIYLFSQGTEADFPELKDIPNLVYCLDMPAQESFLHMVRADILLTSKSSFSYKPALLSDGLKLCPAHFWHGYPEREDWIAVDEERLLTRVQADSIPGLLVQKCKNKV